MESLVDRTQLSDNELLKSRKIKWGQLFVSKNKQAARVFQNWKKFTIEFIQMRQQGGGVEGERRERERGREEGSD